MRAIGIGGRLPLPARIIQSSEGSGVDERAYSRGGPGKPRTVSILSPSTASQRGMAFDDSNPNQDSGRERFPVTELDYELP